jgi:hypothetical protein
MSELELILATIVIVENIAILLWDYKTSDRPDCWHD